MADAILHTGGQDHLVEVQNLKKYFPLRGRKKQFVKAVDNINFYIDPQETFGLIGESGCGKSTVARCITKIHNITEGSILYKGEDIAQLKEKEFKKYRQSIQMIFQDPYSSIDPKRTVRQIVGEPLNIFNICAKDEQKDRIEHYLNLVGLSAQHLDRYPHEFSGGQRQRIGSARALIMEPKFIICDEPISALDVSIQAQIVNLFQDLQDQMGLTYLFIAHDLAMVKYVSDRLGVMYLGQIVESAPSDEIYREPLHPYTKGLLDSIPVMDLDVIRSRRREEMMGEIPSTLNLPEGCRFSTRCPHCMGVCKEIAPPLVEVSPQHFVACHLIK